MGVRHRHLLLVFGSFSCLNFTFAASPLRLDQFLLPELKNVTPACDSQRRRPLYRLQRRWRFSPQSISEPKFTARRPPFVYSHILNISSQQKSRSVIAKDGCSYVTEASEPSD